MNKRQLQAEVERLKKVAEERRKSAEKELQQLETDLLTLGLIPEEFIRPRRIGYDYNYVPKGIRAEKLRAAADLVRAASAQKLDKKRLKELETYRQKSGTPDE